MRRILYLIGVSLAVSPVWAGEYAVLSNGSRLKADRHELDGARIRLFSEGGVTELPGGLIAGFEPDGFEPNASATLPAPAVKPAEAPPAAAQTAQPPTPPQLAASAAKKYSLPEAFVQSVMKAESGFQAAAVSPKGAVGLMQLMPATAKQLGVDPRNPRENAEGGASYLRDLLARYENDPDQVMLALAAYNAGPGAVQKYGGVPPYRETREYILRVLRDWQRAEPRK